MEAVLLVIHLMLALAIIALVLLQQSEGGGLGIGGGGGMGGLATARGTANLLTRLTTIFAIIFMITSLGLAIMAKQRAADQPESILDMATEAETTVPKAREGAVAPPAVMDEEPLKGENIEDVDVEPEIEVTPPAPEGASEDNDVTVPLSE